MTNYSKKIQYDDSRIPIKMSLPIDDIKIKKIFVENYRLPISTEEINANRIIYTFENSVDKHTFNRHLETATAEFYDNIQ